MTNLNKLSDSEFRDWHLQEWKKKKSRLKIDKKINLIGGEKVVGGPFPVFLKKNPSNATSAMNRYGYHYLATDAILTNKRIALGYVAPFSGKEVFGDHNYWFPEVGKIPKTKSRIGIWSLFVVRDIILSDMELREDMFGEHVKLNFSYSVTKNETSIYSEHAKRIFSAYNEG